MDERRENELRGRAAQVRHSGSGQALLEILHHELSELERNAVRADEIAFRFGQIQRLRQTIDSVEVPTPVEEEEKE